MSIQLINWKDGLCLGAEGFSKKLPHVPGVDFSGTVESSDDPRYNTGDKVILTGWRVGEAYGVDMLKSQSQS